MSELGEHQLRDVGRPEVVFQICHPGLRSEFPPLRSLERVPGQLPVSLTSFVGRDRELASTLDALGHARVVTLIGVGGVGKTRLALQAAADALDGYSDGAWFCELAPVGDRTAVAEAVGACLEVRQQPGESVTSSVVSFLRQADDAPPVAVVCNFTPVPRHNYRLGVPHGGRWRELLNSDAPHYGGSGLGNFGGAEATPMPYESFGRSLSITVPPLAVLFFKPE